MISLLLIRHGPTEWNRQRRIQGSTDIPLSDEGRAAVRRWRLPDEFEDYRWVSSPLQRAMETARLMGGEARPEPRLTEMNWGRWEGMLFAELAERFPQEIEDSERLGIDFRRPGGESPRDVQKRLASWLASLEEPTVAVAHNGILRTVHALVIGWDMTGKPPLELEDAAAHLFKVDGDGMPHAERLNIPLETAS